MATSVGFQQVRSVNAEQDRKAAEDISYTSLVNELRSTYDSGKTKDLTWRKQQIGQIKKCFIENHERITAALLADHKGAKIRGMFDMIGTMKECDLYLNNLDKWATPENVKHSEMLGKSYIRREPKGVVLIISPWNFPVSLCFELIVAIVGAGNCCVVKPSEVSSHSCDLINELITKYLDQSAIRVVTGGVPETTAILREKFDHIVYTGNGAIARIVMAAAAKHLTPVTLELGGKSPIYIDASAKLDAAVNRISQAKWINAGQICIAPDYIMVHEKYAEEFKKRMVEKVEKLFGNTPEKRLKSTAWGRVINSSHVQRVDRLLRESKGKILIGGEHNAGEHYYEPTIVDSPDITDPILQEEIFGPLLPIITVRDVKDAVERTHQVCKDPLALYIFAEDQQVIDYYLDHVTSGGVCVNSTMEHISNQNLPFGGIGESGMGRYHGRWGFEEFSHLRSVFVKSTLLTTKASYPEPPYKGEEKLYDIMAKLFITGFLTENQKTMLKVAAAGAVGATGYYFVKSKL